MSTSKIKIPFVYELEFMPLRGTKSRIVSVHDSMEVSVPEVGLSDMPLRIVAHDNYRHDRREFEGRLYASPSNVVWREGGNFAAVGAGASFDAAFGEAYKAVNTLFHAHHPMATAYFGTKRATVERPVGISRVVNDGRDAAIKAIKEAASRLIVAEGSVFRAMDAPVYSLGLYNETSWRLNLARSEKLEGYQLGLDRMDDMYAAVERVRERGGISVPDPDIVVERMDWDLSSTVEAGPNAKVAVQRALWTIGAEMGRLSHDILVNAALLAKARESADPGGYPDANVVQALLIDIQAGLPDAGLHGIKRNVAIGTDLIGLSREFHAVLLDGTDAESLSGVVP